MNQYSLRGHYASLIDIVKELDLYNPDKSKRKAMPGDMFYVNGDVFVWDGNCLLECRLNTDENREMMIKDLAYEIYKQNTPESLIIEFDKMLNEELHPWIEKANIVLAVIEKYAKIEYYELMNIDDIVKELMKGE